MEQIITSPIHVILSFQAPRFPNLITPALADHLLEDLATGWALKVETGIGVYRGDREENRRIIIPAGTKQNTAAMAIYILSKLAQWAGQEAVLHVRHATSRDLLPASVSAQNRQIWVGQFVYVHTGDTSECQIWRESDATDGDRTIISGKTYTLSPQ